MVLPCKSSAFIHQKHRYCPVKPQLSFSKNTNRAFAITICQKKLSVLYQYPYIRNTGQHIAHHIVPDADMHRIAGTQIQRLHRERMLIEIYSMPQRQPLVVRQFAFQRVARETSGRENLRFHHHHNILKRKRIVGAEQQTDIKSTIIRHRRHRYCHTAIPLPTLNRSALVGNKHPVPVAGREQKTRQRPYIYNKVSTPHSSAAFCDYRYDALHGHVRPCHD